MAGLWTCEQPIVVPCCTGVTLLYFSFTRVYFCISFLLYTSLRWPMVHDGRSGGVRSSGSPLTTRQPFLLCDLRGGGVAHCGHAHVQERGQVQPCALSPNTHTGRVAVKRVNQILKLPLSPAPPQKRRQKAFFSPGDFFAPNIYYSSTLSPPHMKSSL